MKQPYVFLKILTLLFFVSLLALNTYGQTVIADYSFDQSLDDDSGNDYTLNYVDYNTTPSSQNYVMINSSQGINLGLREGLEIEQSFLQYLSTTASFEVETNFIYTITGVGFGDKPIFSFKREGSGSAGIKLHAVKKSDLDTETGYVLKFNYADGVWLAGEEGGGNVTLPNELISGNLVHVKLKFFFDQRAWTITVNGETHFGVLSNSFDPVSYTHLTLPTIYSV